MGDVRFPWYARKYCRPRRDIFFNWCFTIIIIITIIFIRRDMVDTSSWKMISTEEEEDCLKKRKSFKQVANTIKTRCQYMLQIVSNLLLWWYTCHLMSPVGISQHWIILWQCHTHNHYKHFWEIKTKSILTITFNWNPSIFWRSKKRKKCICY